MAKRKTEAPGQARLLDAWVPPSNAGDPYGCFATSYTFDSAFFEEECLGRFAGVRSGSSEAERELEWIIECEERFSQIRAAVLVDKDHCRGPRSPRWDLLCARADRKSGIMHAKVSLLIWARHMRLIVASANLTKPGYRQNKEVFLTLEAGRELPLDRQAWPEALEYLKVLLTLGGPKDHPGVIKMAELIREAEKRLALLAKTAPEADRNIRIHGIGAGRESLFRHMKDRWKEANGVVRDICVISPFYDPSDFKAAPVIKELWDLSSERGEVNLALSAPLERDKERGDVIAAPAAWGVSFRKSGEVEINGVEPVDKESQERRPLHAKAVFLENEQWMLSVVGSANMTAAGTGLSAAPNWEAVASTLTRYGPEAAECRHINKAYDALAGELVADPVFEAPAQDDSDEAAEGVALPDAFEMALYRKAGGGAEIELSLRPGTPAGWTLAIPGGERLCGEPEWRAAGSPAKWAFPWVSPAAPSGFDVEWTDSKGNAWLPVCVANGSDLPPPAVLRELTLEQLIQILTTARPLAATAAAILGKRLAGPKLDVQLDPHRRVDVSGHLIPKTRRISAAMAAMRRRLSEPAANAESLAWRLDGHFGVRALLQAVDREWEGAEERAFFRAELCLELSNIAPAPAEGCLSPAKQRETVHQFLSALIDASDAPTDKGDIIDYARRAFAEAKRTMA